MECWHVLVVTRYRWTDTIFWSGGLWAVGAWKPGEESRGPECLCPTEVTINPKKLRNKTVIPSTRYFFGSQTKPMQLNDDVMQAPTLFLQARLQRRLTCEQSMRLPFTRSSLKALEMKWGIVESGCPLIAVPSGYGSKPQFPSKHPLKSSKMITVGWHCPKTFGCRGWRLASWNHYFLVTSCAFPRRALFLLLGLWFHHELREACELLSFALAAPEQERVWMAWRLKGWKISKVDYVFTQITVYRWLVIWFTWFCVCKM